MGLMRAADKESKEQKSMKANKGAPKNKKSSTCKAEKQRARAREALHPLHHAIGNVQEATSSSHCKLSRCFRSRVDKEASSTTTQSSASSSATSSSTASLPTSTSHASATSGFQHIASTVATSLTNSTITTTFTNPPPLHFANNNLDDNLNLLADAAISHKCTI